MGKELYNEMTKYIKWFGILFLTALYLFFMIRGENITVKSHDQLDGEVLYYMLRSSSIHDLITTHYESFMSSNAEVTVPAFFALFLFYIMPPVYAFITNMFLIRFVAFLGLFQLLKELNVEDFIGILVSLTFSLLPIYSVYGLSSMGVPLVSLAFIYFLKDKNKILGFILITIYGLYSSLVLVGFAVIGLMIIATFFAVLNGKKIIWLIMGTIELSLIYLLSNIELIKIVLGYSNFISHKSDYVLSSSSFIDKFLTLLINGQYHAVSLHKYIYFILFICIVIFFWNNSIIKSDYELKVKVKMSSYIALLIIMIAIFYGIFLSPIGVYLRNRIFSGSALLAFQFDRVHWLYPTLWYILFGILLSIIYNILSQIFTKNKVLLVIFICWSIPSAYVVRNSDLSINIYNAITDYRSNDTWKDFYATDLFDDINEFIARDKKTYKVISLGLHPSVALYNGFYCLDGYSNNYMLNYKYEFLQVIKDELQKNTNEYKYYMNWGNRCYAFSSELGQNFYVRKDSKISIDSFLNVSKLQELGCEYIFSAVKINNANNIGLEYDGYFEKDESYYGIYLYNTGVR